MNPWDTAAQPYLLLTPGPATVSPGVRRAMLRDDGTWDSDYHQLVQHLRTDLVALAGDPARHTAVLLQGSGTFAVEATLGSVVPPGGKLLLLVNGAYGERMVQIATCLRMAQTVMRWPETEPIDAAAVASLLAADRTITHVALVHLETTTGLLNPAAAVGQAVRAAGRTCIVDAMSSFGGVPLTLDELGAHYLVASANKCLQGVPGLGLVLADRETLAATAGWARSLSLDLYSQWIEMDEHGGKWRYTSPTQVVRALAQALTELAEEGGVAARHARYHTNQQRLVRGMAELGFAALLPSALQSPVITSFREPEGDWFTFGAFYDQLKAQGFLIYPGKLGAAPTFRIGNIGHLFAEDIERLLRAVARAKLAMVDE